MNGAPARNLLARLATKISTSVAAPAIAQLKQGAEPNSLALTCAAGVTLGAFPLMGTTTILCATFGYFFRLNQPLLQSINYLMSPAQLALIPVFGYLGSCLSRLLGTPIDVDLHPSVIVASFAKSPVDSLRTYGVLGAWAVLVWAAAAPLAGYVIYVSTLASFGRVQKSRGRQ